MLQALLDYRLDWTAFAIIAVAGAFLTGLWLRHRYGARLSRRTWVMLVLILVTGALVLEAAGDHERERLQEMLQGIAPTYAREMERLGHANMRMDTSADDPAYLTLINSEIRWLKANPMVNDIYTFRRDAEGKVHLIVDSETDYDHNGKYEGERESRTPIAEVYEEVTPNMQRALDGQAMFDAEPYSDRWGTWVSAYAPLRDEHGHIEGALGVDYNAAKWLAAIARTRATMLGCVAVIVVMLISGEAVIAITRSELAKRQALQQQLVEASRRAGMAEVATGVLHNVGNVLNSVNVAASTIAEKLRSSKVGSLARVVALLRDRPPQDVATFLSQDEKGKQLPVFLTQLSDFMAAEQQAMMNEVALLSRSIDHIKQIVNAQQEYAKHSVHEETFTLAEVVDEALRLAGMSLERHAIQVERRVADPCPTITGDRHFVLQIVVNLLSNAKKSVSTAGIISPCITFEVDSTDANGKCIARLKVIDNGVGIDPLNLPKIFSHGFTTRSDGHGFGLHASANSAHAMGGSLDAGSDGVGHGATFTLELPTTPHNPAKDRATPREVPA